MKEPAYEKLSYGEQVVEELRNRGWSENRINNTRDVAEDFFFGCI